MPMHDWTRVDPNDYHHFHVLWLSFLSTTLNNGVLPQGYFAMAEHVAPPTIPDILTLTGPDGPTPHSRIKESSSIGGVALADSPPKVRLTETSQARKTIPEAPRRRIAVRHVRGRQLVAVIELVSPANKSSRRELMHFVDKAVDLLAQGIHLFVIDPFPPTKRDPSGIHGAIWKELAKKKYTPPPSKPLTLASYLSEKKYTAFVEPLAVGDTLQDMPLFLTPDLYVNVPLESTYAEAWRGFPAELRPLLTGKQKSS